jgi:hypothetical protein
MKNVRERNPNTKQLKVLAATIFLLLITYCAFAQDGNAGINAANTQVRSYFATGTNLMYAVGAIVGLIGAVKVYQKWNSGDQDTGKVAGNSSNRYQVVLRSVNPLANLYEGGT